MTAPLTRPTAVLFDWDNTLIDSWVCIQEAQNRTFRHFGMAEWSMEETKARVALSLRDSFPSMFGDRWEEARDVFYAAFEAIHMDYLRPLPGAARMLETLREAGLYLGVVSNKRGPYLRAEAAALGWQNYFGALIGATDAEADKPSPAPVRLALAPSGTSVGRHVWFVGDAPVDINCAANSGCTGILLREQPPRNGEFDPNHPDRVVQNCDALVELVCQLSIPIQGI